MSRIYGVVCDGCRHFDVLSVEEDFYEDKVPRNGWISVNAYAEDGAVDGPELHACSGACLEIISRKLRGMSVEESHQQHHHHHHEAE